MVWEEGVSVCDGRLVTVVWEEGVSVCDGRLVTVVWEEGCFCMCWETCDSGVRGGVFLYVMGDL